MLLCTLYCNFGVSERLMSPVVAKATSALGEESVVTVTYGLRLKKQLASSS